MCNAELLMFIFIAITMRWKLHMPTEISTLFKSLGYILYVLEEFVINVVNIEKPKFLEKCTIKQWKLII